MQQIRWRILHVLVAIWSITEAPSQRPCFAAELTAWEILEKAKATPEPVRNVFTVLASQIIENGQRKKWSEIVTYADDTGRRRVDTQHGIFGEQGERVPTTRERTIFDGRIHAEYDFNYSLKAGPKKPEGTITSVGIYDQKRRQVSGTFPDNTALRRENNSRMLALADPGSIKCASLDAGVFEIQFTVSSINGAKQPTTTHRAIVDASKGWAVVKDTITAADGTLNVKSSRETAQTINGFWFTKDWQIERFKTSKGDLALPNGKVANINVPPSTHLSTITEIKVNDPEFSDEAFRIVLPARAMVWDSRYQIDYRVVVDELEGEAIDNASAAAQVRQKLRPQ